MIQAMHKGIEIDMEMRERAEGIWMCDYSLIRLSERSITLYQGTKEYATSDLAQEHALEEACAAIDKDQRSLDLLPGLTAL